MLTDEQWDRIQHLLRSSLGHQGRPYSGDHRTTIEAIRWIARTGAPWRDLPAGYGRWITVYQRYRRWTWRGTFQEILDSLDSELDLDVAMIDGTFLKAHQHAAGTPREDALPTCPDKPRPSGEAGRADFQAHGSHRHSRPHRQVLAASWQRCRDPHSRAPLAAIPARPARFMADKAYDSNQLREHLANNGTDPVIPAKSNIRSASSCDMDAYKAWHLLENAFADLKQFRGNATRYCKLAATFTSLIALCCFIVNTRSTRRGPSPHLHRQERQCSTTSTPTNAPG